MRLSHSLVTTVAAVSAFWWRPLGSRSGDNYPNTEVFTFSVGHTRVYNIRPRSETALRGSGNPGREAADVRAVTHALVCPWATARLSKGMV